jgi:ABC-2 type transport system permease protein
MTALLVAEWRRMVAQMTRYPGETISSMMVLFLVFAGLFYGARYMTAAPISGARLATVVIGYAVWMLMMSATGDMGWSIQNEAQNGTLEQVMLVPWAAVWVFLVRAVMSIAGFLLPEAVIIAALIVMTGVHFVWSPLAAAPVAMVLVTAWGLGLVVAALALVLKRVGQVLQIVQFLLLFVILSPVATLPGWAGHLAGMLVPFAAQVGVLHRVLEGQTVGPWLWLEAGADMIVFLVAGVLLFKLLDGVARAQGILGHY